MAPLRALFQALLLALVLLSASLGQLRGSSRSLTARKSSVITQQWYFSKAGRGKMQTSGATSANRRMVRADPNAGSQPISFAAGPGPVSRNSGQAIGFAGNGNPASSGDPASQPQGDDLSPTNPFSPIVEGTSEVAPSPAGGISDLVPHQETAITPAGVAIDSSPPASPASDLEYAGTYEQEGVLPSAVSVATSVPSASGPGGGSGAVNNNINITPSPDNKLRPYRTRDKPRCANNSRATPCEEDDDYNDEITERVRSILRDSRMNAIIENSAVTDLLQDSALVKDKTFDGPSVRFGPEGDFVSETPACRAQESIIYPQRAKTTADDWVFVINQDTVKQGVRVEKCIREGENCDLGVGQTPTIRTTCRQKFIYRKLLVLSNSGNNVQPESVLIPSCCVCYIRKLDELVSGRIFNGSLAAGTPLSGYAK